jgi:hypothetical protein
MFLCSFRYRARRTPAASSVAISPLALCCARNAAYSRVLFEHLGVGALLSHFGCGSGDVQPRSRLATVLRANAIDLRLEFLDAARARVRIHVELIMCFSLSARCGSRRSRLR